MRKTWLQQKCLKKETAGATQKEGVMVDVGGSKTAQSEAEEHVGHAEGNLTGTLGFMC